MELIIFRGMSLLVSNLHYILLQMLISGFRYCLLHGGVQKVRVLHPGLSAACTYEIFSVTILYLSVSISIFACQSCSLHPLNLCAPNPLIGSIFIWGRILHAHIHIILFWRFRLKIDVSCHQFLFLYRSVTTNMHCSCLILRVLAGLGLLYLRLID